MAFVNNQNQGQGDEPTTVPSAPIEPSSVPQDVDTDSANASQPVSQSSDPNAQQESLANAEGDFFGPDALENVSNEGVKEIRHKTQSEMPQPQIADNSAQYASYSYADETQQPSTLKNETTNVPQSNEDELSLSHKDYTFEELLQEALRLDASDIHFNPGYRAVARINGVLENINSQMLTNELIKDYAKVLIKERPDIDLENINEVDLTYAYRERRFRVNIYKQMGRYSIVCRIIPERILTVEELGLPTILKEFIKFPNGLVIVAGPTGNGKSTTIASILNLINLTQSKHIVTLEDPIEYVFPKGVALVSQREWGVDFKSWGGALRSVLRQDPNVVLVGEMRDLESVEAALQVAETGHLVFATLHTNSASQTIDRIIDIFPAAKQEQIRIQVASVIRAVVSQRLLGVLHGGRRVSVEIMVANAAVKNAIRDKKSFLIDNIIQTSNDVGMVSMEKSLVRLIREGFISEETAKTVSLKPSEIKILLER